MPLTDLQCRTAKPREKPYKLGDSLGLFLLVQPTGGKLWRLKFRIAGREDPQPKAWAIPNFAPAAEVTLFTGAGSAGKSLLAQQLCTAMEAGIPTLGLTMEQAPSIYIICEDEPAQLHWRQEHICRALGVPMASLAGKFLEANLRGEFDNALAIEGPEGFEPNPTYHRLARLVRDARAKLVALDNIAHLFIRNENDRGEVTRFVDLLNRLAGESGAAILLIGHPNKAGDSYSGSTAWPNAVRSHVFLRHCESTDVRTLTAGKANYGRKGEEMRFVWVDWAFVLEGDLMACLRARETKGDRSAPHPARTTPQRNSKGRRRRKASSIIACGQQWSACSRPGKLRPRPTATGRRPAT